MQLRSAVKFIILLDSSNRIAPRIRRLFFEVMFGSSQLLLTKSPWVCPRIKNLEIDVCRPPYCLVIELNAHLLLSF
ncbi:MAG: hypothetical protein K2X81_20280, partial [Candidatus Obscuribacterales bacterium]|nr:hypothetical protein [Candidatus Obscuribacterales bacterium]